MLSDQKLQGRAKFLLQLAQRPPRPRKQRSFSQTEMEKSDIAGIENEHAPVPKILDRGDSRDHKDHKRSENCRQKRPDHQSRNVPGDLVHPGGACPRRLFRFDQRSGIHRL